MKRVLITGSSGFIGSQLVAECLKCDFEVWGIDLAVEQSAHFYKADIRSPDIVEIIPGDLDAVIHLAAMSDDRVCRGKLYECFDYNVLGTLNVMKAAQKCGVRQFIFASTEWVYGDKGSAEELKDENTNLDIGGLDSNYALSKLVSEISLKQEYKSSFLPTAILRFGIIYGLRKSGSAVETIFNAILTQYRIEVNSLKTARRFVHVSDIIDGIIKSIGLPGFNIIGLEGDQLITLKDIVDASQNITNRKVEVVENQPDLCSIRNVSNAKTRSLLGWRPRIDLETGLRMLLNDKLKHIS